MWQRPQTAQSVTEVVAEIPLPVRVSMLVKTLLLGLLLWMGMVGTVGTVGTAVEGIVRPFGGKEEFEPDYNVYSNLATVEERLTEAMSGWPGWTNARVEVLGKSVEGRVLRAGVFGKGKKSFSQTTMCTATWRQWRRG